MLNFIKSRNLYIAFLFVTACLFFGLSNCFTGWFLFLPVFLIIDEFRLRFVWIAGGLYGIFSYFFYATWLYTFSKIAMAGVSVLYFFYWAILFVLLKIIRCYFSKIQLILEIVLILCFEIIKASGFIGFSYGVCGYTQYQNLYLIQISDILSVYSVSFILIFCSALSAECFGKEWRKKIQKNKWWIIIFFALIIIYYVYGFIKIEYCKKIENKSEKLTVAAIQNNSDPWKSGFNNYKKTVNRLMILTDKALNECDSVDFVVWPETAVVPSILKHYEGNDERRRELVNSILNYIDSKKQVFLIGNFNSVGNKDYNSAFVFIPKKNVLPPKPYHYEKQHLVPFTEYFPYKNTFPWIYELLLKGDTHLWEPGKDSVVFDVNGFKFSAPICFEDNFAGLNRTFVKKGASAFFSLSNDAWSKSKKCQIQHLKMGVFRSVENHIPSVRCTVSGETCIINSYGRIEARLNPFEENILIGKISKLAM